MSGRAGRAGDSGNVFIGFFISGKAISTFSLLFGIGFAVQMMRAEARGRRIA